MGEGDGAGPGALGGPGEALGRGLGGLGGGRGVAGPLVPIGPIDYCSSILYILSLYPHVAPIWENFSPNTTTQMRAHLRCLKWARICVVELGEKFSHMGATCGYRLS